jgi:hypothetical protein
MRRLLRILLNAAAVLSVLLGIASIVLWRRSHRNFDCVERSTFEVWFDDGGKCGRECSHYFFSAPGQLCAARLSNGPFHFADGEEEAGIHKRTDWVTDEASTSADPLSYLLRRLLRILFDIATSRGGPAPMLSDPGVPT